MKELVEVIAKSLVDNPNEVHVNEIQGEQDLILELRVAPEDMGKVIGKQGRVAKAIRTVVKAAALNENQKVVVEIIDVKSQDFPNSFFMCAQHGQQLDGESPLWAWQWEPLANDKGVYCEVESEESRRQSLGLRNTNYIQGLLRSDEFA